MSAAATQKTKTPAECYLAFNNKLVELMTNLSSEYGSAYPDLKTVQSGLTLMVNMIPESPNLAEASKKILNEHRAEIQVPTPNKPLIQQCMKALIPKYDFSQMIRHLTDEEMEFVWLYFQQLLQLADEIAVVVPSFFPPNKTTAATLPTPTAAAADSAASVTAAHASSTSSSTADLVDHKSEVPHKSEQSSASECTTTSAPVSKRKIAKPNPRPNIDRSKAGVPTSNKKSRDAQFEEIFDSIFQSSVMKDIAQLAQSSGGLDGKGEVKMDEDKVRGLLGNLAKTFEEITRKMDPSGKEPTEEERVLRQQTIEHTFERVSNIKLAKHTNPDLILADEKNEAEQNDVVKKKDVAEKCRMVAHFHEHFIEFIKIAYQERAVKYESTDPCFARLKQKCIALFLDLNQNPLTEVYVDECSKLYHAHKKQLAKRDPSMFFPRVFIDGVEQPNKWNKIKTTGVVAPDAKTASASASKPAPTPTATATPPVASTSAKPKKRKEWTHPIFKLVRTDKIWRSFTDPVDQEYLWSKLEEIVQFLKVYIRLQTPSIAPLRTVIENILMLNNVSPDARNRPEMMSDILYQTIAKFGTKANIQPLRDSAAQILANQDFEAPFNLFLDVLPKSVIDKLGIVDEEEDDSSVASSSTDTKTSETGDKKKRSFNKEKLKKLSERILSLGNSSTTTIPSATNGTAPAATTTTATSNAPATNAASK